jgi:circadian clock protein KaiC
LTIIHKAVSEFKPQAVVVDPLNAFVRGDNVVDVQALVMRLVDFLKGNQITAVFTNLTAGGEAQEATTIAVSSIIDTWLLLRDIEINGERNRGLYVLKSRGMPHSNQIREFLITDHGIELREVYLGPGGVLTGSARLAQEAQEKADQTMREQEIERLRLELERKRRAMELQIASMRAEFELQEAEYARALQQDREREAQLIKDRIGMGVSRHVERKARRENGGSE